MKLVKFDNNSTRLWGLQSLLFSTSFSTLLLYSWINYHSTVVLTRFSRLVQLMELREVKDLAIFKNSLQDLGQIWKRFSNVFFPFA